MKKKSKQQSVAKFKKRKGVLIFTTITLLVASVSLAIAFPLHEYFKARELETRYSNYCKKHPLYYGSFSEWLEDIRTKNYGRLNSYETFYNIIYTIASVPPVIAALNSIENNCETYALISRGKIYSGINDTSFHNLGFDPTKIVEEDFNQEQFENTVETIKQLNVYGHEHFNIFEVCFRGMDAAALVANAGLTNKQYQIYMIEDGNGTYINDLQGLFIYGKQVAQNVDEPYDLFKTELSIAKSYLSVVMKKTDNKITDPYFIRNPKLEWALATFNNFNFILQDQEALRSIFAKTGEYPTKMASVYGFGDDAPEKANVIYQKISDKVNNLNNEQIEEYLKLMYGQYYDKTYKTLTRTTLDDGITKVPNEKLVFIGSRIKDYSDAATDEDKGIGKLNTNLPQSYDQLDNKYKMNLLFDKREDYESFLAILNNPECWKGGPTAEQKEECKTAAFNYMLNYMFNLKLTYKNYKNKYDVIIKGHPAEEIDHPESWSWHFMTEDGKYCYDNLMSTIALDFHSTNSVGKYIATIPYGTAAENLAYLGVNLSIGGLPSSTYTGYDTSIPVEFVIDLKDSADGGIVTDPNLSSRYQAGNLFYYDELGNKKVTRFINRGKFFEIMRDQYQEFDEMYIKYDNLRTEWLKMMTHKTNVDGYSIDDQGFWHAPN